MVAADLLAKGYEVFRAVSPSCSCDLAILRDGKLTRVEVRTGYRNGHTGAMVYARKHRAEIVAVAIGNEIVYEPELA